VRTGGTVITAPQAFDYLIKMQDRILDFIARHSKADREELHRRMMRTDQMANDVGSVLDGEAAVACGLIDRIGGLADAMRELEELKG
ncbi:MAG: ATP-dependent Clp protease proteolytic subunit, partial [Clostridia bacterium]|nr:ATP-dependent Clp protease proteolytic subunit [Clostridia bacterium]